MAKRSKQSGTQIGELMQERLACIHPESSLSDAAARMDALNCGILPVGDGESIVGVITDRDIVVRAVAAGKNVNNERVEDYMTPDVLCCDRNSTIDEAAELMRTHRVGRLLVKDEDDAICGIITFGSIVRKDNDRSEVGEFVDCAVGKRAA